MTRMTTTDQSPEGEVLKTDVLGRVRVKPEVREQILDDFERSGMSGRAFAKLHGIHQQTFASWIQKRRRARGDYDNEEIRAKLRMGQQAAKPSPKIAAKASSRKPTKSTALSLIVASGDRQSVGWTTTEDDTGNGLQARLCTVRPVMGTRNFGSCLAKELHVPGGR